MSLLFLFIFFHVLYASSSLRAFIPVFIDKLNTGHEVYSADLMIGHPPIEYRLQIDFAYDKISLFKNSFEEISSTWSNRSGGYDDVFFHHRNYKMPVVIDPEGGKTLPNLKNEFRCKDCKGILGLSPRSAFFKIFGKVSFSNRYITLGEDPNERRVSKRPTHTIECKKGQRSLCVTPKGSLTFGNVHYNNLSIDIDPSSQKLILPYRIFDEYMLDKNVYDSLEKTWEPIILRSYDMNVWNQALDEPETLDYVVNPKDFIFNTKTRSKILGISRDPSENQVVSIGSKVLRNFIMERTTSGLALTSFTTYDRIDNVNLLLALVQFLLVARWFFTVSLGDLDVKVKDYGHKFIWFQIWYEWLGIVITIVAALLPQTFDLLENHQDLYIGTWFLLAFAIGSKIGLKIYYSKRDKVNYFLYKYPTHYLRLVDSFTEQISLLTGVWILVLKTRTEGGDSTFLFIVNLLLLFVTSFYFKIAVYDTVTIIIFSNYGDQYLDLVLPKINKELGAFLFFSIGVYIYQTLITVNFFARPFFLKNLNLEDRFAIPVMILLYLFTEIVSLLTVTLFIHYNNIVYKNSKNEQ